LDERISYWPNWFARLKPMPAFKDVYSGNGNWENMGLSALWIFGTK